MKKLFQFSFLPVSPDAALLVLRLWFGLMLATHGWDKVMNFSAYSGKFMNLLGLGQNGTLALAIFGELVCSLLLVFGLFTRFAALGSGITMGVAFFMVHHGKLQGEGSGEMAYLYLGVFVALFFAGGGRFSIDRKLGSA
jgi:putative oxidoreductase